MQPAHRVQHDRPEPAPVLIYHSSNLVVVLAYLNPEWVISTHSFDIEYRHKTMTCHHVHLPWSMRLLASTQYDDHEASTSGEYVGKKQVWLVACAPDTSGDFFVDCWVGWKTQSYHVYGSWHYVLCTR